jgi:hypothetical protein
VKGKISSVAKFGFLNGLFQHFCMFLFRASCLKMPNAGLGQTPLHVSVSEAQELTGIKV